MGTLTLQEQFERLAALREAVVVAEGRWHTENEVAKGAKKAWETKREEFEQAFDRVQKMLTQGPHAELPLFQQAEANEAARNRPEVKALVEALAAVGFAVDGLVVAGFSDEDRAACEAWARDYAAWRALDTEDTPAPVIPAVLQSVDDITADALLGQLRGLDLDGIPLPSVEVLAGWTPAERVELRTWAEAIDAGASVDELLETMPQSLKTYATTLEPPPAAPSYTCTECGWTGEEPSRTLDDDLVAHCPECDGTSFEGDDGDDDDDDEDDQDADDDVGDELEGEEDRDGEEARAAE